MPLPSVYGNLLERRIMTARIPWLVSTGWTNMALAKRMPIRATRANATLDGSLNDEVPRRSNFGQVPRCRCRAWNRRSSTPAMKTWSDKIEYDITAQKLVHLFIDNFAEFADHVDEAYGPPRRPPPDQEGTPA